MLEIKVCLLPRTYCFIVDLLFLEVVDLSLGNKIYLSVRFRKRSCFVSKKKKILKTRLVGCKDGLRANINYDAVGTTPTKPISDHAHTIIHFYQITYVSNHLASLQIYNATLTCLSWRRLLHVIVATSKSRSHKVFPGGYQNEVQREVSSKLHRICSTVAKKQAFERLVV